MIKYLLGRILNNKWLFICLLAGAVIACSISSSIPLYTNAILQRVLTKDLENYHISRNTFPGLCNYACTFYSNISGGSNSVIELDKKICGELAPEYSLPVDTWVRQIETHGKWIRRQGANPKESKDVYAGFVSLSDIENRISLIQGKLPENAPSDGVYEVLISDRAMKELKLVLGETYSVLEIGFISNEEKELLKVKICGVFSAKAGNELYWGRGRYSVLDKNFLVGQDLLLFLLDNIKEINLKKAEWTFYFDYRSIKIDNTDDIINTYKEQQRWGMNMNIGIYSPLEEVIGGYAVRKSQLSITLWFLTIPLMIIVALYTIMITGLIVKNDSNEIAVLKSRGAGTMQIFLTYIIESLFVALLASISGPFVAIFICRVIGASNGFLQFVNRKALDLNMDMRIFLYSFAAGFIFLICMLIPAFNASRVSIVQYKRSKLNTDLKKPLWQRLYLDVIVLIVTAYGYYGYKNRQDILGMTGLSGEELAVDPLLYFISTFFILGICLLFLRIYPLVVRAVFRLGEKWWNPVAYFSLINVGRADRNLQFIMVFVVLALAFGIMNANQARAINRNIEDKVKYELGADVVIEPYNNLKHLEYELPTLAGEPITGSSSSDVEYIPPPYEEGFKKIEGVEHMTKVIVNDSASLSIGKINLRNMRVIGIIPHEFGNIAWFRNDLLPWHINDYLNLMTAAPKAVYLSSNILKEHDIRVGDEVRIRWGKDYQLPFIVYGFVDYFPTCNPYNELQGGVDRYFAIMNYRYIESKLPAQPYEIWVKKSEGVKDSFINQEIEDRKLRIERVEYLDQKIIEKKNDPMLQGTNGVLTMCFVITMLIATTGFIIFWTLSIKERALKFGIFRAIGMPMSGVTLMIVCEQILVSGCSASIGFMLGSLASSIFIPLLQLVYSAAQQVPPFIVIGNWGDYFKVTSVTMAMLLTALLILYAMVRHIRVYQVIKLGED